MTAFTQVSRGEREKERKIFYLLHYLLSLSLFLPEENRHLNVPREHTSLIEFQTLIKAKLGVSTHESLDKILTESVFPIRVDPILDRPGMPKCRSRTGQEHNLEGYPHQFRPGLEERFDPDMHIR